MKNMKSILPILMFSIYFTALSANPLSAAEKDPFSEEISRMLFRSSLIVEKDLTVKVFFVLNEEKEIQIKSISSSNEAVIEFLRVRLNGQQLKGSNWHSNKIYELPVRVKAIR